MEKIIITIETVNAAFDDAANYEVARILRELADQLEASAITGTLRDINGNKVGSIIIE